MKFSYAYLSIAFVLVLFGSFLFASMVETVEPGHEAVGVLFGEVTGEVLDDGFHIVNPLVSWDHYSIQNQTALWEDVPVPAKDQQSATMDVSVQWKIRPGAAVNLRADTGIYRKVWDVHFIPISRAALRDAGRSTKRVEDFYNEENISRYRLAAMEQMNEVFIPLGLEVTDVLVRNVSLPSVITKAIEDKKQREQQVEQERAELERVALAAQQSVKKAEADRAAAEERATAIKTLAEAESYKIKKLQEQLAKSPQYIELVKAERWNGTLPTFVGGDIVPLIQIK